MRARGKKTCYGNRRGVALLVVLLIVMVGTILSLSFLSRSDIELACGENMVLRSQMDYMAESGLEHAKGLILHPQDVSGDYWSGGSGLQIVAGSSDYYDVTVEPNTVDSGATRWCNYDVTSQGYRLRGGEEIGRSRLSGELRLDPCIAMWAGGNATIRSGAVINGDAYCGGVLTNLGAINGDVFANVVSGSGSMSGHQEGTGDLSLDWPRVRVDDFTSHYTVQNIEVAVLPAGTFLPSARSEVCYRNGDLKLLGASQVRAMLVVDGDLTIEGSGNVGRGWFGC